MRSIKTLGFITEDLRMRRYIGLLALLLAAVLVPGMTTGAKAFEEVAVNIEVNATDADAGVQFFLDGGPWKRARIKDPNGKTVFSVSMQGKLKKFGGTENFTESNEPNFGELSLPEILEFLPAGVYTFDGRSIENEMLDGAEELTHDLPCEPEVLSPVSMDPEEDPVLEADEDVVISWAPVEDKLDTESDSEMPVCLIDSEITIVGYEVIVENESTEDPTEKFTIKLQASESPQVTLPPEFIIPGSDYKFEILAIEESGNQTITESFFSTTEEE